MTAVIDVSIVIPFYERQREVETLLAGLDTVERDGLHVETLVVQDGSAVTRTSELVARYPALNVRFLSNGENRGPGFSRNHGAREARGRYFWFIDSDAEIIDTLVLRGLVRALDEDRACLAAGGVVEKVDDVPYIMRPVVFPSLQVVNEKIAVHAGYGEAVGMLSTTNFFMRADMFRQAEGFDAGLVMFEDNEFCLRLQTLARGVFYQGAHTLVLHTMSPNGRASGFFSYFADRRRYMHIKLMTRNVLMRRYKRWRLICLPVLEDVSVMRFAAGLRRWRLARLAMADGPSPVAAWVGDMLILMLYTARAMGLFFRSAPQARKGSAP